MIPSESLSSPQQRTGDSAVTADVARGVCRHLSAMGFAPLLEFTLGSGRRADVAALNDRGEMVIVEIKVSVSDFKGDAKWQSYLDYCDQFYFAVPGSFPKTLMEAPPALPETTGLMVADRFDAAILRPAAMRKIAPARRKAESLRFARKAATRLHGLMDASAVL
jgi:hypothetical protein